MADVHWVERETKGIAWAKFSSTQERRLVFYQSGSAIVKPTGRDGKTHDYWVPLFGVQAIGLVNMTPLPISFVVPGELTSREGLKLSVNATAILRVRDSEAAIRMMALHPEHQQQIAISNLSVAFQRASLQREWSVLRTDRAELAVAVLRETQSLPNDHCALEVIDVAVETVTLSDADLEQVAGEFVRADTEEKLRQAKAEADRQRLADDAKTAELRVTLDTQQFESSAELNRRKLDAELDEKKRRAEVESQLQELMNETETKCASARAAVYEKAGGLWALNPDAAMKIKIKELEVERESREEMVKILMQMARQARVMGIEEGQGKVLMAFAEKQLGLTIKAPDLGLLAGADPAASANTTASCDSSKIRTSDESKTAQPLTEQEERG